MREWLQFQVVPRDQVWRPLVGRFGACFGPNRVLDPMPEARAPDAGRTRVQTPVGGVFLSIIVRPGMDGRD